MKNYIMRAIQCSVINNYNRANVENNTASYDNDRYLNEEIILPIWIRIHHTIDVIDHIAIIIY